MVVIIEIKHNATTGGLAMNRKILFNDGWEFAKSGLGVSSPEGLEFQPVDLPHDWLIYNTLSLYESSIGW